MLFQLNLAAAKMLTLLTETWTWLVLKAVLRVWSSRVWLAWKIVFPATIPFKTIVVSVVIWRGNVQLYRLCEIGFKILINPVKFRKMPDAVPHTSKRWPPSMHVPSATIFHPYNINAMQECEIALLRVTVHHGRALSSSVALAFSKQS